MSRLDKFQDWEGMVQHSNWCAAALAKQCRVSVRTLERYFRQKMGRSPKAWLDEQRQRKAVELLSRGLSVKETAICLGYKHSTHFSREFKKYWGLCPTRSNSSDPGNRKCRVSV
jgi:AraC-like DNA-binding protein